MIFTQVWEREREGALSLNNAYFDCGFRAKDACSLKEKIIMEKRTAVDCCIIFGFSNLYCYEHLLAFIIGLIITSNYGYRREGAAQQKSNLDLSVSYGGMMLLDCLLHIL